MSELKQQLKELNQTISHTIKSLDDVIKSDIHKSEELASSLQGLIDKRQLLIEKVTSGNDVDADYINQQKALAKAFMDALVTHRQYYFDALAKVKPGTKKINLYQDIDSGK
ncbi:hypothetical protein D5018_00100 [Parashewanella curva]|uniref:Uncharacterized protein n=1 Tax=Parashewanella curva TaxID=2338552 RepID=A0A3L8Q1M8_9GAMM|nr:hypothetical protein [Parashewanella curva]RLV61556.1 hypothetical protein D5018_00100 [Parashewanella curva]